MHVTRRNLAVAGALALGTSSLLRGSAVLAASADEAQPGRRGAAKGAAGGG